MQLLSLTYQKNDGVRLRAAIFVNLVAMRSCMARGRNPEQFILSKENHSLLVRANFLLHAAHAGVLVAFQACFLCCGFTFETAKDLHVGSETDLGKVYHVKRLRRTNFCGKFGQNTTSHSN